MAKGQRHRADDTVLLLDGENLTAERLDIASIEMRSAITGRSLSGIDEPCCVAADLRPSCGSWLLASAHIAAHRQWFT